MPASLRSTTSPGDPRTCVGPRSGAIGPESDVRDALASSDARSSALSPRTRGEAGAVAGDLLAATASEVEELDRMPRATVVALGLQLSVRRKAKTLLEYSARAVRI